MQKRTTFFILMTARMLVGFSASILLYMLSSYFSAMSQREDVGVFFLVMHLGALLILLIFHRIIAGIGRSTLLLGILCTLIILSGVLIFYAMTPLGVGLTLLYVILGGVAAVLFEMIAEGASTDSNDGRMHGALLTLYTIAFLLGALIGGTVVDQSSFSGVFAILLFVYSILFILTAFIAPSVKRLLLITHDGVWCLIYNAWRYEWFKRSYILTASLYFFYTVIAVYMPLHLLALGFTLSEIGVIFALMLVPYIIIEYPAGVLADKVLGEREMLLVGLAILIISLVLIVLLPLVTFMAWVGVLFFGRIGAALLEDMSEIFFYKHVTSENIGLIDVYRTAPETGRILGVAVSAPILMLSSNNLTMPFAAAGFIFIAAFFVAWRMHDTKSLDEL